MKVLMIGDIVSKPGRDAVAAVVPRLRREEGVELVVANAENIAGGAGITASTAEAIFASGVDVITLGDHTWDKREGEAFVGSHRRVVRPANYPEGTPGRGWTMWESASGIRVAVINLCGRVFMPYHYDDPFRAADRVLKEIGQQQAQVVLLDFHAEATSEKIAIGRYLDGRLGAIVGSHTHIQTADEQILPKGTAYLTDLGMTGPYDSVLGRKVEDVLKKFLTQMPMRYEVATDDPKLCGAIIDIDVHNGGKATAIRRVQMGP